MQRIDFIHLSWIPAPKLGLEDAKICENEGRTALVNSMGPLRNHGDSNRDFTNCSAFVDRDTIGQKEVCQFERCRSLYLQSVLSHARSLFSREIYPEENYFKHAKGQLRAIDPDLVGESRFQRDDWYVVKIYKTVRYLLNRQIYSWVSNEIPAWKTCCTVMEWGATQNPHTVVYPKTRDDSLEQKKESQFVPKTVRDHLIRDVFLQVLGFVGDDVKSLQGILGLLPGEMKTQGYNPKTKEVHFTLERTWIGRPNWKVIDQNPSKSVPDVIAPISMLIEELQKSGTPIPDILKTVGDRLAIVPKNVRLEIAQTVKGTVSKESDGVVLKMQEGVMRLVIPARFGLMSPDIYIDITELKRLSNGTFTLTIKPGASFGFDTTVKGLTLAITKLTLEESSTTFTMPPKGKERPCLPDEDEVKSMHKNAMRYLQWGS